MTVAFDQVVVAVPDLDVAAADYEQLFDCELRKLQHADQAGQFLLPLANTCVAIVQADVEAPAVAGLVMRSSDHQGAELSVPNALGLSIEVCDAHQVSNGEPLPTLSKQQLSVDHVVLRTNDADACIDLFQNRLGVRLALDKTVEKWGGRMLFFRSGKMTLEVIASDQVDVPAFWGIAYQCADIEAFCAQASQRGVTVSEIREGRKPQTLVATIKSHCLGIPTLLIQQLV
ncbi:MAG: VOC family protein [Halioglobus sp.]